MDKTTYKLASQKDKSFSANIKKHIKAVTGKNKVKGEPIYCFGQLEYIVILDGVRSGRVTFTRELDGRDNVYYEVTYQQAECL